MDQTELKQLLKTIDVPYTSPDFYNRVFSEIAQGTYARLQSLDPVLGNILGREYLNLTDRLKVAGLQEACSVRNVLKTRALAQYIINENGEFLEPNLLKAEKWLQQTLYSLGPERQHDARREEHILSVIQLLKNDRNLRQMLMKISRPANHRVSEQVIRDTLQVPHQVAITDGHARQAALSAWLCYLRQNVGSCFATAPAIIIHDEQPQQLLRDLDELLMTGRLKRTFSGVEYSAPISSTWGAGDLRRRFGLWRDVNDLGNTIIQSPGIVAGLKATRLIPLDIPQQSEVESVKQFIGKILDLWEGEKAYVLTNAEDLFKRILMTHFNITAQDIIDYENRPKPMISGNLMMQATSTISKSGLSKSERCAQCIDLLETACNAFKSLTDNALLRVWEFTVASFAETKANFTKWNLYSSLGLGAEEPGGIGNCLQQIIQHKLEQANRLVQSHQEEYEAQYTNLKYMEARIKRATTEQEAKWLNIEYQTHRNEFYTIETLRNKAHRKAQVYANLFNFLINRYVELFPNYFQEVYDADLHDVDTGPYDDSPAGFRLLFKHGRSNTALWTRIYNPTQYVESLSSFFTMTEPIIQNSPELEGFEEDLTQIVTAIVSHVKTLPFIESSLYRMAASQGGRMIKDPLNHLDKLEKKPWAYTSGGNMETLVSCYFRSDQHTTSERWVENEIELAVFLLDLVKKMPANVSDNYLRQTKNSLLIHSPTHAFLFKAGFDLFKRGVSDKTFTYTWVRDQVYLPAKRFAVEQYFDRDFIRHLITTLEYEIVPFEYRDDFKNLFYSIPGKLSATEFREHVVKEMTRSPKLQRYGSPLISYDEMDSFLFKHLPLTRGYDIENRITEILDKLTSLNTQERAKANELFTHISREVPNPDALTAQQLQNLVKVLIILVKGPRSSTNYHKEVAKAAQELGYAMPPPLIFADTNWVTDFFGFAVNPGTGEFELWRVDEIGTTGAPMSYWKQWLNGSRRDRTWGLFTNPTEYRT